MMVALLIPTLFIGALLAAGTVLWSSWNHYGREALAIGGELKACQATRSFRYETTPSPRRSAQIFRLAFKPRAASSLPFQPELRAAA